MQVYANLDNSPTLEDFLHIVFHGSPDVWLGTAKQSIGVSISQLTRAKRAQAWYMNLSTFDADDAGKRRRTGRGSHKSMQQDAVHLVVLDDIGTKVEPNDLAPTYVIESSDGNQQWGYVYTAPVKRSAAKALFDALGATKLTDAGVLKTNQLVRVPCGINGKKDGDGVVDEFPVTLRAWNPERLFTVDQLVEAWGLELNHDQGTGIVIQPGMAAGHSLVEVLDDRVLSVDEDKIHFVCPELGERKHSQHTGEKQTSALIDADGGFTIKCLHDSCSQVDLNDWAIKLAAEKGIELSVVPMPDFSALPTSPASMVEVTGLATAAPVRGDRDWLVANVVTMAPKGYYDLSRRVYLSGADSLDMWYAHLRLDPPDHDGRRTTPAVALKFHPRKMTAAGQAWQPTTDAHPIIQLDGVDYVNTYRREVVERGDARLVEPWLRVVRYICGEHTGHVLDHMAFTVQRPEVKIRWQILVHGRPRTGKTLVFKPLIVALGSAGNTVNPGDQEAGWGDIYVHRKALMFEEVFAYDTRMFNKIKTYLANDSIESLNVKGKPQVTQQNLYSIYLLTNHDDALQMSPDEDKLLVLDAPRKPLAPADYYACGAPAELSKAAYWYLRERDITRFDPDRLPVRTEALLRMCENAAAGYEQDLREMIETGEPPFNQRAFSLGELLLTCEVKRIKANRKQVARVLRSMGFENRKGLKKVAGKVLTRRVWAHDDVVEGLSSGEIFDLLG